MDLNKELELFKSDPDLFMHFAKSMSDEEYRVLICEIEKELKKSSNYADKETCINAGCKLEHAFIPGMYIRSLTVPGNSFFTTDIHMYENPFFLMKGEILVFDGKNKEWMSAPYKTITQPGTKRIIQTFSKSIIVTCHVTDKTTVEEVENYGEIVCETYSQFDKLTTLEKKQ